MMVVEINSSHLDETQLNRLIRIGDLEKTPPEFVDHIGQCELCQNRMERLAAQEYWWKSFQPFIASSLGNLNSRGSLSSQPPCCKLETPDLNRLLEPAQHPELLGQLDQYKIESMIGFGGMGVVLKGFDTELHRTVAIKMVLPHLANDSDSRQRFLREARSAAAISHEHIVDIFQVRADVSRPYLVMSYVAGSSIRQLVEQDGPLGSIEIVRYGMQIAFGLAAAHGQGLIHRDIKPDNILLNSSGQKVVITDFGLARALNDVGLTKTGIIAGTPNYMSPEQCEGHLADELSDLFSLGCVLYFMATGQPPYSGETSLAVMNRICNGELPFVKKLAPDLPKPLANIIHSLLEKKPAHRLGSATETADLLKFYLAHLQNPNSNQAPRIKVPPSLRSGFLRYPHWLEVAIIATAAICTGLKLFIN